MKKQLLLVSSSRCKNGGYFEHCSNAIKEFFGPMTGNDKVAFVPYALKDHDGYTSVVSKAFLDMGYKIESVHTHKSPKDFIVDPSVKAIFVGGGNTFRLLNELHKKGILETIRAKIQNDGIKYMGSSSGSNIACPTIMTTNDMPIVMPPNFNALGFVDFQINPHFIPGSLMPGHMGETRETRIKEYHEENNTPVIGLTEANWITVNGDKTILHGERDSFIFEKGKEVRMWRPETELVL
ncbi:MAG: dipeptidase PepE [Proteobacteria bacterium]|nr:dipeptidase PepE [Pseudomonadota bacterium]